MRKYIILLCALTLAGMGCARREESPGTLLFLGDSITEAEFFVREFEAAWNRDAGHRAIRAIPRGRGSESVTGLTEAQFTGVRPNIFDRLDFELKRFDPDWVVVCYGMNCGLFQPFRETAYDAYQTGMTRLVETARAAGAKVVVLTPPPFARPGAVSGYPADLDERETAVRTAHAQGRAKAEQDPARYGYFSPYLYYDDVLALYSGWLTNLAQPGAVWVVDLRAPLLAALETAYDEDDPVHPNREGHRIMAETLLREWREMDRRRKIEDGRRQAMGTRRWTEKTQDLR